MDTATEEFIEAAAAERRADREAAAVFAWACANDRGDLLRDAADGLNMTIDGWRLAMLKVGRLAEVSPGVRSAFVPIWVEKKTLPASVGDRRTLAKALRVLFGTGAQAEPLRLYRGCAARERRTGSYGFSWSTKNTIARSFAELRQRASGGAVVLETVAPPGAVLFRRDAEGWFDEEEVVVDPYRLETVAERLTAPE